MNLEPTTMAIDLIDMTAPTQVRVDMDDELIDKYRGILEDNSEWPFPPIIVYQYGDRLYVGEGWHRLHAAHRAGWLSVPVIIQEGNANDAWWANLVHNARHGKPLCKDDFLNALKKIDNNATLKKRLYALPQRQAADLLGMSVRHYRRLVKLVREGKNPNDISVDEAQARFQDKVEYEEAQAPETPPSGGSASAAPPDSDEPEVAIEAWESVARRFKSISEQLDSVYDQLKALKDDDMNGVHIQALWHHLGVQVRGVRKVVDEQTPAAKCVICLGGGCQECSNTGWITTLAAKEVTA